MKNFQKRIQKNPGMSNCELLIDSMAIKKEIMYNTAHETYVQFVDYDSILPKHSANVTSKKLMFIIVGLRYPWKCPVG